jgi:hypothetical protein
MSVRAAQNHNQGQAAIEALLIIVVGFTLMLGVHHIGQVRSDTLHLLGESHFLSFIPKTIVDQSAGLVNNQPINERHTTVRLADLTYSAQQREIENQLGFDTTTLLRASAQSASRARSHLRALGLAEQASLERYSFLLSGTGQAESPHAAQTKITSSTALWQESFAPSQQLVNASRLTLQSIDRAWGRPTLTSDWLLPWANEVLAPKSLTQASVRQQAENISRTLNRGFK